MGTEAETLTGATVDGAGTADAVESVGTAGVPSAGAGCMRGADAATAGAGASVEAAGCG
jgi:hypothetical protein